MRRSLLRGVGLRDGLVVPAGDVAGVVVVAFNGGVSYKACHRRNDESLSGCGSSPESRVYLQWFQ